MLKNALILLFIILLLFVAFVIHEFLDQGQYTSTFNSYIKSQYKIPQKIVDDYFEKDPVLQKKASEFIIQTTLKNLGYEQWFEYIDYIDLKVYEENVLPGEHKELIVVLNLSKDLAVIGIYTLKDDHYIFTSKIEDLLPVKKVEFKTLPNMEYNLIITDQILDESLGAFFVEEFKEIFLYLDDQFKSVWKKTKYMNEIYNMEWIKPDSPSNQWMQVIEDNTIQFKDDPNFNIVVSIHRKKLKALKDSFPLKEDFKLIEETRREEYYHWSPKYKSFIMKEGIIHTSATPIAIIDDTSNWLESFMGLRSNNYKIMNSKGEISFIKKEFIKIKP